jgi:hypothetical protein
MCFSGGVGVNYYNHGGGNELFFSYLGYGTIPPNGDYLFGFFGAKLTTATMHFTDGSTFDFLPLIPQAYCQQPYPYYAPDGFYRSCDFPSNWAIPLPGSRPLVVSTIDIAAELDEGYDLVDAEGEVTPAIGGRTFQANVYSVYSTGWVMPEPATLVLVASGLLALGGVSRTRRRR